MDTPIPWLTAGRPCLRGVYKARWEDFVVHEVPAMEPAGHGDHTWLEVEKHGLTTATAAADLARALGVKPSAVGYAGLKDARAIARQWMSVEHVDPARALAVDIPRVRVLRAGRHPRKLRRGWHRGNRFIIRLRSVTVAAGEGRPVGPDAAPAPAPGVGPGPDPGAGPDARPDPASEPASEPASDLAPDLASGLAPDNVARDLLALLARRGVPNLYGPQRFGYRGDTWRVGRALARGAWAEAAALIAGRPLRPDDDAVDPAGGIHADGEEIARARALFDRGRYAEAAAAWPRGFGHCARLAAAMERTGGDAARAIDVVGKGMLRLYAAGYQAWLFNRVLARRMESAGGPDRLLTGDLAWKHDTEALFLVDDPAAEAPRAAAFEVSPTGPLVGRRMRAPEGPVRRLEEAALADAGFRPGELESRALRPLTGRRRPLRFRLTDATAGAARDDEGPYLELRFTLPPGCYATAVLRELGRGGIVERGLADLTKKDS